MKKIVGMILIGTTTISRVFANDCNVVLGTGIESTVLVYNKIYEKVLPSIAFKQALTNLKAYCCLNGDRLSCSSGEKENLPTKYFPESIYLFDHLIDVAMRRLDGITGLVYNMGGDPKGVTPDPTGLERRNKITEIAKTPTGALASSIESLYTGYRTLKKPTQEILIQQYNNTGIVSLGDKYDTICELMIKIYDTVANTNKTLISKNFLKSCEIIARDRVNREVGYTKIIMVQKSNQLFDEGTKAYTKKHFVQEKLMSLWNLIVKVQDLFQTIIQQSPASKTCSK